MKRVKILVAEDDAAIARGLEDALESEGYAAVVARDGRAALERFGREAFDLVLLDVMMPGVNGYDVCREIRKSNAAVPVVMLTAKGEEIDKVVGLELGADDYITKPFGVRELLARIAAVLRRSRRQEPPPEPEAALPDVLRFGDVEVDRKRFTAARGKKMHTLTAREVKLVEYFHARPGEVLGRDAILNAVWGLDYLGTTRTLDQHIAQLRKKIEKDLARPAIILTVHGAGYRYNA